VKPCNAASRKGETSNFVGHSRFSIARHTNSKSNTIVKHVDHERETDSALCMPQRESRAVAMIDSLRMHSASGITVIDLKLLGFPYLTVDAQVSSIHRNPWMRIFDNCAFLERDSVKEAALIQEQVKLDAFVRTGD